MADIQQAIDVVLRQEDARLSGVITTIPGDSGGRTRFGIAERWHPELTATGFFTTMPAAAALTVAEGVYAESYGKPLMLAQISAQGVATALLSFGLVEGCVVAITLLQRAAVSLGAAIAVDGKIGPATVAAVNALDAHKLLVAWGELEKAYFAQLAARNPADEKFVTGWDNRAQADEELV